MTRDRLWWVLGLLVLVAGGWWLSANTEWTERSAPRVATGEARDNPVYAFEQLLRKLGLQASHHETLEQLPPPGARLVLLTNDWNLVPGRGERLHQWVEQGGHLVLLQTSGWGGDELHSWVPVSVRFITEKPALTTRKASTPAADPAHAAASNPDADEEDEDEEGGESLVEKDRKIGSKPLTDGVNQFQSCDMFVWGQRLELSLGTIPTWYLNQAQGAQGLRIGVGRGSVTVLNATPFAFQNWQVLECGHPFILTTALQAEPGATVWVYLNEKREPLVPWLWHSGWIAIVFGALALTAALWRHAVRFGPRIAAAPRLRRSISEQVRGLGSYLHRHGSEALLVAQQRALEDTATRRLAGYSRLAVHDRARLIAQATGVPQADLFAALSARFCTRVELPHRLQVLESARRRLYRPHDERHPR